MLLDLADICPVDLGAALPHPAWRFALGNALIIHCSSREIRESVLSQLYDFRKRGVSRILDLRTADYFKKGERKDTRNQSV